MNKKILITALFSALMGFSGSVMAAADGEAVYKSKCLMCHGAGGKGTVMGVPLASNAFISSSSDQVISEVIQKGREGEAKMYKNIALGMPAQQLANEEVSALIDYLKSLSAK